MSLLANESFQKQVNKDPEGYGKDFGMLVMRTLLRVPPPMLSQDWNNLTHGCWFSVTVPITLIASTKKIKSLTNNTHLITQALRSSSKLVSILDEICMS